MIVADFRLTTSKIICTIDFYSTKIFYGDAISIISYHHIHSNGSLRVRYVLVRIDHYATIIIFSIIVFAARREDKCPECYTQ